MPQTTGTPDSWGGLLVMSVKPSTQVMTEAAIDSTALKPRHPQSVSPLPAQNQQEFSYMQAPQLLRSVLAATAFAGVMAAPAQAVVVTYTGPALTIPSNIDGLYLNVLTGATNLATGSAPSGWDVNVYNNNAGLTFFANTLSAATVVGSGNEASVLLAGAVVGPSSSFASNNPLGGGIDGASFQSGGDRFFGFRFTNEATGGIHYGWGLLRTTAGDGFPAQLLTYAYENAAGVPITVVPEPGTYALMLAGLAGIAGFAARRRKAN